MSIPILPSSAPFSDAQRAWLNGFFAGLLGVEAAPQNGALPNETNAGGASPEIGDLNAASISPAIAEQAQDEYPWHDPNLPLDERMQLAENKPFPLQLMAAMAQLDCGSCGYLCHSYAAAIASGEDKSLSKCSPGGSETMKKLKQLAASRPAENDASTLIVGSQSSQLSNEAATEEAPRRAAYDKAHPFPAGVLEVVPLTRKDSEKDVRHVALDLRGSGLEYEVGDALGVYPENCPELVELLLERLEATGEEPVLTPEGTVVPARLALSKAYVITHCADEWLQTLSHLAADPDESSRLASMAQNDENDYLEDRDTLDVLNDFPSARASTRAQIGEIISAMAPLRPRLYSISSSLKAHSEQVHLTVGVVRYQRRDCERTRKGVASTFLSERMRAGAKVGVFVQKSHGFRLPQNPDAPIIMVGPGTGIAPFRAFLQERAATGARGKNWLFFGDQRRDCDFLYREELGEYSRNGLLSQLDLAFSRDQAEKIYVQHRMEERGAQLWRWLEDGAHFYVCGDARRMARDVDAALQNIAREHGAKSDGDAKAYVAWLAREGRYSRDVY